MVSRATLAVLLVVASFVPDLCNAFVPCGGAGSCRRPTCAALRMSSNSDAAAPAGRARGVGAAMESLSHGHEHGEVAVEAKAAASLSAAPVEAEEEDYGDDADAMADARETVASALKTGSLVDPAERVRIQMQSGAPGSARATFFANVAVLGVLVGAVYFAGKAYFTRQEHLVEAYASEMVDVLGNPQEMDACHREYKLKLGPKQFRGEMFAAYIVELARKKPISCQTLLAADYMRKKFGFKSVKVAKLLAEGGQSVARKQPGLRSKMLFYGERLAAAAGGGDAATHALQPLRDALAQSYRSGGAQIVASAQASIAEQALRDSAAGAGGNLPEGYELLGMSEEAAREVVAEGGGGGEGGAAARAANWSSYYTKDDDEAPDAEADPESAALYKQLMDGAKESGSKVAKAAGGGGGGAAEEAAARAFECQKCGYTLFVAKGREWKFFGEDYKCPECGASKAQFQEKEVTADGGGDAL